MTYNAKSNDSFNARLRFYLFYCVLHEKPIDKNEFLAFDIDKSPAIDYVNLYTTEYQQFDREYTITEFGNIKNNNQIYDALQKLTKESKADYDLWKMDYKTNVFSEKLSEDQFKTLLDKKECAYCKITINEIEQLANTKKLYKKNERGFNLELDRKFPNMEYSNENCVMACYWCNNAKTDEFTAEEFAPIGKEIGKALKNRLK